MATNSEKGRRQKGTGSVSNDQTEHGLLKPLQPMLVLRLKHFMESPNEKLGLN